MDCLEIFSKRLKELRLEEGLTQKQFANKAGLSQSDISAWELGIRMPFLQGLVYLAKAYNCSIDYLVGLE